MPEISLSDPSRFNINLPGKPMLARVAESMYWMNRYIERAEHLARLILVNSNVLIDIVDLATKLEQQLWQGVLRVMHLDHSEIADKLLADENVAARVSQYMTFDADNGLLACLSKARENARSIRENISGEMWENLNTLYWTIRGDDARQRFVEAPHDIYREVMTGSFLFQGLTNQTLGHGQGWLFGQLAKHLERADITCRIIETKFDILSAAEHDLDGPERNIHWMAVLRSCCSIEEYRRMHPGDMDPMHVATFLVLEHRFPRSICYSVRHAHESASGIRGAINQHSPGTAERILVRLHAQLEHADPSEIAEEGVQAYLQRVREKIGQASMAVQGAYFLR
jgi:uncharacterized alpha-E superfamily protein